VEGRNYGRLSAASYGIKSPLRQQPKDAAVFSLDAGGAARCQVTIPGGPLRPRLMHQPLDLSFSCDGRTER
jgi:hypothetical protein